MQQSPLMLWRFVLMLIRIRRSKDLLKQFQEFECSSLFAFHYCVYWTTRYNTYGGIGTKWLFFFTFTEECCFVMEKNIGKKLPNRISDQVWYKRYLKGTFGRGVQICEGGPYPLADLDRGGPYPLADLDRESKSAGRPNPLWHRYSSREIRAEIPKATPIFAFHESSKPF